jgi:LPXTG-motif cell wall-anchored protein
MIFTEGLNIFILHKDKPWRDMLVTDVTPYGEDIVYPGGTSRSSSERDHFDVTIALAVIFSLLGLALLAALVFILWRRNKRRKEYAN